MSNRFYSLSIVIFYFFALERELVLYWNIICSWRVVHFILEHYCLEVPTLLSWSKKQSSMGMSYFYIHTKKQQFLLLLPPACLILLFPEHSLSMFPFLLSILCQFFFSCTTIINETESFTSSSCSPSLVKLTPNELKERQLLLLLPACLDRLLPKQSFLMFSLFS